MKLNSLPICAIFGLTCIARAEVLFQSDFENNESPWFTQDNWFRQLNQIYWGRALQGYKSSGSAHLSGFKIDTNGFPILAFDYNGSVSEEDSIRLRMMVFVGANSNRSPGATGIAITASGTQTYQSYPVQLGHVNLRADGFAHIVGGDISEFEKIEFRVNTWHEIILNIDFGTGFSQMSLDGKEINASKIKFGANSLRSIEIKNPWQVLAVPDDLLIDDLKIERLAAGKSWRVSGISEAEAEFYDKDGKLLSASTSAKWLDPPCFVDRSGIAHSIRVRPKGPYLWSRYTLPVGSRAITVKPVIGDVNRDNVINTDDYLRIHERLGQKYMDQNFSAPNPLWDSKLDLDMNSVIDGRDIAIMLPNLGTEGD